MSDFLGSTLGPYRLLEQIGLGGMATVYKAYQPGMDRLVALKVLPSHYARDPRFLKRFEQEARVIAKLEHRNIVPVYDFGEQDGTAYLAMRYLQAGTVKNILSHGPLPLTDAAKLLADIAVALDYAHAQGIVHRDVKPSNILVDKHGDAYLTDFGIAKVLESASELTGSAMLGTPTYMAPEQTIGKPVTPQSDVYSLGVMLYEMVIGKPPYEADTPIAIALMHVHEPLPLPRKMRPDLPEAVELVILKALAKESNDRYQSAGELARAFAGALNESGPAVDSPPNRLVELANVAVEAKGSEEVTYEIREEIRRRDRSDRLRRAARWLPWAIGTAAIVGLAIGLYFTWQNTAQRRASATETAEVIDNFLGQLAAAQTAVAAGNEEALATVHKVETQLATAATANQVTPIPTFTPTATPNAIGSLAPTATLTNTPTNTRSATITPAPTSTIESTTAASGVINVMISALLCCEESGGEIISSGRVLERSAKLSFDITCTGCNNVVQGGGSPGIYLSNPGVSVQTATDTQFISASSVVASPGPACPTFCGLIEGGKIHVVVELSRLPSNIFGNATIRGTAIFRRQWYDGPSITVEIARP